jgi:hypothetical protein
VRSSRVAQHRNGAKRADGAANASVRFADCSKVYAQFMLISATLGTPLRDAACFCSTLYSCCVALQIAKGYEHEHRQTS